MSTPEIALPLPRLARARWAALPVVLAGTFMVVLDFFTVNVAMPAMQADLHAGTGAIDGGFAHAFEISLAQLALLCVAVAALTRLLPRPAGPS